MHPALCYALRQPGSSVMLMLQVRRMDMTHESTSNYAIKGTKLALICLQDEGWRPSITVKQILMGIQVRASFHSYTAQHPLVNMEAGV